MRGRAIFTSFYEQLKGIRTFHRKYPNTAISHEPSLDDALNPQIPVRILSTCHRCRKVLTPLCVIYSFPVKSDSANTWICTSSTRASSTSPRSNGL